MIINSFEELLRQQCTQKECVFLKKKQNINLFVDKNSNRIVIGDYYFFVSNNIHYVMFILYSGIHKVTSVLYSDACSLFSVNNDREKMTNVKSFSAFWDYVSAQDSSSVLLGCDYVFTIKLPDNFDIEKFSINSINDARSNYKKIRITRKAKKLERLLFKLNSKYQFDINISDEICKVLYYDDVKAGIHSIKEMLRFKISNSNELERRSICFRVPVHYGKDYFSAAILSSKADAIYCDSYDETYYLLFNFRKIDEIYMMHQRFRVADFSDRVKIVNCSCEYNIDLYSYLQINHPYGFIFKKASDFRLKIKENHNVWIEPFSSIYDSINRKIKKYWDDLYIQAQAENRVVTKWINEYCLYRILHSYYADAIYQYRAEWLGQQSLDVFIPTLNAAIEYQGKQHYEPVEFLGGENHFAENKRRDLLKKQLCEENGIQLFEWKYIYKVHHVAVEAFLKNRGIVPPDKIRSINICNDDMAPVYIPYQISKKNTDKSNEDLIEYIIRQYTVNGEYIKSFLTVREASIATQVSENSISRICRNEKGLAGGYQWRKVRAEDDVTSISPHIMNKPSNAKKVVQLNPQTSEQMQVYDSISIAAKETGVDVSGIRKAINGQQRLAGGYKWMFLNPDDYKFEKVVKGNTSNKVAKIDSKTGEMLKVYNSQRSAANDVGVDPKCIYDVLRGKQKSAGGFKWEYYIEE